MDIKEASAMTEVSGVANDQDGVTVRPSASGLRSPSPDAPARWAKRLRQVTVRAPLQSLFVAFLLGVWIARRR
jgi:hypothetical protein